MAFCRFSSDNWSSDIYAYPNDMGGITISVASKRIIGNIPKITVPIKSITEFTKEHNKQSEFIVNAQRESINLPEAGKTFYVGSFEEVINLLENLKEKGFNVPDSCLDAFKLFDED